MPRGKTKAAGSKAKQSSSASNLTQEDETGETKSLELPKIKQEPTEGDSSFSIPSIPDLSKFKFEKKPHVKIEFEKASPEKQVEKQKGSWEPKHWKDFLINLRIMRANNDAPVDTMGCKSSIDEMASPEVYRYQSLISLMLSSQTKDQVTFAAMEKLRARGLTIDNVLNMSDEELGQLIYPVGFWKTKVKYIKKTTQTLKEQYNGDIPDSVEKLCKLTGVGPKMAHICMKVAWNKITGIGVDTHVHRISNRIGWVKKPTATPEDTRKALESWLPVDLWSEVNHLLVGFGQTICTPISPFCNECLNRDICPSSGKGRKSPNKRTPVKIEVKDEANSEDEFVEDTKGATKRKITPKKVQPLQLDAKLGKDNNLEVNPKKDKKSPKQKVQKEKSDEVKDNIQAQKDNVEKDVKIENVQIKEDIVKKARKSPKPKKDLDDKSSGEKENAKLQEDVKNVGKTAQKMQPDRDLLENNCDSMEDFKIKKTNKSPLKRKSPRNKAVPKDKQNNENSEEVAKKKKVGK